MGIEAIGDVLKINRLWRLSHMKKKESIGRLGEEMHV